MNLLLLTHRVPFPPDRGDRIRALNLLRYLHTLGSVSLGSVSEEEVSDAALRQLSRYCKRVAIGTTTRTARVVRDVLALAAGRPATEGHFWSPSLAKTVASWSARERFDAVICFCSSMYQYYAKLKSLHASPLIMDFVDVDSQKWADCAAVGTWSKRWLLSLEAERVRRLEDDICRVADEVVVISDEERRLLNRENSKPALVAPNGVDADYFSPSEEEKPHPFTCCFVGVLNYAPNVDGLTWFVNNVWGSVLKSVPQARLMIVGKSPNAAVHHLAQMNRNVEIHANVSDVRPYMARSMVSIAPLRVARGIQNKVLEAMSMSKPVVASPAAITGIDATEGTEYVQANTPEEWKYKLVELFHDAEQANEIGRTARLFVLKQHGWASCLSSIGEAIQRAVSTHASRLAG